MNRGELVFRKEFVLLLVAVVSILLTTGCDKEENDYQLLDTDKAAEVALEYMNNKYDTEFQVISSIKDAEYGYIPGTVQDYWCDVELAVKDSDSKDNYTVRVTTKDSDEDYIIEWDNYMSTLVAPVAKKDIDSIVSEMKITDYFVYSCYISEKSSTGGFKPDFNIDIKKDTLSSIFEKSDIWLYFNLYIPESAYKKSTVSEFEKALGSYLSHGNSDDYVSVSVLSFDDGYYSEIKKISESGNELSLNHEYKAIHEDVIKLN